MYYFDGICIGGYNPKNPLEAELHHGSFYTTVQLGNREVRRLHPDIIGVNSNKEIFKNRNKISGEVID